MDVPLYVIAASTIVALGIPLLFWSFAGGGQSRAESVRKNLSGGIAPVVDERRLILEQSPLERAIRPAIRALAGRARRLTPVGWLESLESRIRLAGSPRAWNLERVLAVKLILGVASLLLAVFWLSDRLTLLSLASIAGLAVAGYLIPDLILYGRARERQQLIQTALPDTLDQMTISVEAGLGFDAALKRIGVTGSGPLAEELNRTLHDIKVGVPRAEALRNMVDRTDVPELRHFVFAVQQAEEYGLPIAHVLRVQAGEIRVKRRQRAEERALKMPVKIVFPLVFCIFPALFVVLLGPAMIRISTELF